MDVTINGCRLNVEVLRPGGRAGADRPPRRRRHRLARRAQGDLRTAGRPVPGDRVRRPRLRPVRGRRRPTRTSSGRPTSTGCGSGSAPRRSSSPAARTAASSPSSTPSGTPTTSSADHPARHLGRRQQPGAGLRERPQPGPRRDRLGATSTATGTGRCTTTPTSSSCWSELIPLYDFEYDPVKSAAAVEAGIYRHEAHNWCFQHNWARLRPQGRSCPRSRCRRSSRSDGATGSRR